MFILTTAALITFTTQEKKVLKVNKSDTIHDVIDRVCSKLDVSTETDKYEMLIPSSEGAADGKHMKSSKTISDYKLSDNVCSHFNQPFVL